MPSPPEQPRHPLHAALLLVMPLLVGLAWYCRPGDNIGDVCDHRFNMFIMEHGYQWLVGRVPDFWDAGIFYPATHNTVAFSDAHIGNLPFYAPFRLAGLTRENAMAAWLALVCLLNYASAAWVLRKLTATDLGAALGAYLFTFGLPVIGQMQHVQLFPRYFVPLAFFFFLRSLETRARTPFVLLATAVVGQLYTGLYIGIFLLQILGFFALAHALLPTTRAAFLAWLLPRGLQPWLFRLAVALASGLVLVPMMLPYLQAFHDLGGRSWPIVVSMVMTPLTLLLPPDHAVVWNGLAGLAHFQSTHQEHRMFIGGLVPLMGLAYVALRRKDRGLSDERLMLVTFAAVLLVGIFTARLSKSLSLYYFLYVLPGVGSLRAIARIMLVLLFPIGLVLAWWTRALESWIAAFDRRWLTLAFGPLLLLLLVVDQLVAPYPHYTIAEHTDRLAAYRAELQARPHPFKAFVIVGPHAIVNATDALLVAQDTGMPTSGGYSGNFPKGWSFPEREAQVAAWLDACNQSGRFAARLTLSDIAILHEREGP